jgi:hypothetical protein
MNDNPKTPKFEPFKTKVVEQYSKLNCVTAMGKTAQRQLWGNPPRNE